MRLSSVNLTAAEVEREFKELVDESWDWQVRKLSASDFAVVFPSKESLRLAARNGGGLRLPFSQAGAEVSLVVADPLSSQLLPVALRGLLPDNVRLPIVKLCAFLNAISQKVIDQIGRASCRERVLRLV